MLREYSSRLITFGAIVILTSLAWVYVSASESRTGAFPGDIPLTLKNTPEGLIPVTDEDSVKVRVRADQQSLSALSIDSFTATVDLKGLNAGTYELPVAVAVSVPSVQVVAKEPATVRVTLEESLSKEVPVRVVVQGKAAEGKSPADPIATPNRVTVIGAKSVVAFLSDAEAVVTLGGETSEVQRTVSLQAKDKSGKPLTSIRFEPSTVGVKIPIVQSSSARTVGVRVVTSGNVRDGYYIQKVSVTPATVAVTGSSELAAIETRPVDVTDLATNKTFTTDLVLPAGVVFVDKAVKATVTLTVSPIPTVKQVPLGFSFADLDPTLKISNYDPGSGKISVGGTADVVAGVTTLTATLSLMGKGEGVSSLAVTTNLINLPVGVTIVGAPLPSAVSVTLVKK